jgi:hypothetical protein
MVICHTELKRNSKMTYQVTKQFTTGKFKGQSITEKTIVPFKVGTEYKSVNKRGDYIVQDIKKLG